MDIAETTIVPFPFFVDLIGFGLCWTKVSIGLSSMIFEHSSLHMETRCMLNLSTLQLIVHFLYHLPINLI